MLFVIDVYARLILGWRVSQSMTKDFMLDALACGRPFRTFNITDDFNREAVHIEIDTSITSLRLVRIFERIRQERPLPQVLRTDNVLTLESTTNLERRSLRTSVTPEQEGAPLLEPSPVSFHVFRIS